MGELTSRLGTDTEVVQALVGSGISVALRSAVMLLGATAMMVWTSPHLAGLTALVISGSGTADTAVRSSRAETFARQPGPSGGFGCDR